MVVFDWHLRSRLQVKTGLQIFFAPPTDPMVRRVFPFLARHTADCVAHVVLRRFKISPN